jgi:hypothetical protein
MNYLRETGAIIGSNNQILRLIKGSPCSVDFPAEFIWRYHKQTAGSIFSLAHTHPSGFDELSATDKQMFEAWAWALYPWPIRMHVITNMEKQTYMDKEELGIFKETENMFVSKCFLGQLESKEDWIADGKLGKRNFTIVQESEYYGVDPAHFEPWVGVLINESFK